MRIFKFRAYELCPLAEEIFAILGVPMHSFPVTSSVNPGFYECFEKMLGYTRVDTLDIMNATQVHLGKTVT